MAIYQVNPISSVRPIYAFYDLASDGGKRAFVTDDLDEVLDVLPRFLGAESLRFVPANGSLYLYVRYEDGRETLVGSGFDRHDAVLGLAASINAENLPMAQACRLYTPDLALQDVRERGRYAFGNVAILDMISALQEEV